LNAYVGDERIRLAFRARTPKNKGIPSLPLLGAAMLVRFAAFMVILSAAFSVAASDEIEALLLQKFAVQNKIDAERVRMFVNDSVAKAKEIKDTDPERGIDLLRATLNQIDGMKSIGASERRALFELIRSTVQELRETAFAKRREKASQRLDAFKDYLESSTFGARYAGRAGSDKWEPANFMSPDGQARVGKLIGLGTGIVTHRFGPKEIHVEPLAMPLLQVFGGFYVLDRHSGHHVFMTNREFYDTVWLPLIQEYTLEESALKPKLSTSDSASGAEARLRAIIDSGVYFLRALPGAEPIAGIGPNEDAFLAYLAQGLVQKGLPIPINRVYARELQDRLVGFSVQQWSAARRALYLLQARDVKVSPASGEFLRDETSKLLKSEYSGFTETETNRAVLYIFAKLN